MVVSSILSLWVAFQRSTIFDAALVPLARTHMVIVSAEALVARAVAPISTASAAQVVRAVMNVLPGHCLVFCNLRKSLQFGCGAPMCGAAPIWEKLFPIFLLQR